MKFREKKNQSAQDIKQFGETEKAFKSSKIDLLTKIENFPRFATRQTLAKFLARHEIFKKILPVNGSIIECGVLHGAGLFTFAKLSSIYEPINHTRKIIGFDTFSGFPSVHAIDKKGSYSDIKVGGLRGSSLEEIQDSVALYDANRPLAHIPKIDLVKGDIIKTAPAYVKKHRELVVAMLYLDLDLYEPTKAALQAFVPLMPKGAVIVFDELNAEIFPGETRAVDEVLGLRNLRIERFSYDSYLSYCVME